MQKRSIFNGRTNTENNYLDVVGTLQSELLTENLYMLMMIDTIMVSSIARYCRAFIIYMHAIASLGTQGLLAAGDLQ